MNILSSIITYVNRSLRYTNSKISLSDLISIPSKVVIDSIIKTVILILKKLDENYFNSACRTIITLFGDITFKKRAYVNKNDKNQQGDNKQDKDKDKGEDNKQNPNQNNGQDKDQSDKGEGKPRPSSLSPEQMERILEAMNNEERKTQEKINAQKVKGQRTKAEKDW